MLNWLRTRPAVDPDRVAVIQDSLRWWQAYWTAPIPQAAILPNTETFPDGKDLGRILLTILDALQLDWPGALVEIWHGGTPQNSAPILRPEQLHELEAKPDTPVALLTLPIEQRTLYAPVDAIAGLMRAIAWQHVSSCPIEHDGLPVPQHLDVGLIALGFGLFQIRSSFRKDNPSCGTCGGFQITQHGALSLQDSYTGFALWLREHPDTRDTAVKHLDAGQQKILKRIERSLVND